MEMSYQALNTNVDTSTLPLPCLHCLQSLILAEKETRTSLPLSGYAWLGHHLDLTSGTTHYHLLSLKTNILSLSFFYISK